MKTRSVVNAIGGALVAFAYAFLEPAHGAEITVDTADPKLPVVVVSGELKQGDHKLFVTRTVSLDNALVVFESGGGNLMAGLEIGKAIRLKEFHTYVPDKTMCASACALAWLGGTERYLARTSSVGFHAAYRTEGGTATESGMGNAMVGAYLNSLGLPSRAIAYMTIAAPDSMQWLTAADAEKLGIDVILLNDPSTIAAPTPTAPQAQPPAEKLAEEQRFWAEIEREIPNWSEINKDPNFHAWLLSVDELSGVTRQTFLEQAQKSLDAKRVIAFFKTYLALNTPAVLTEQNGPPTDDNLQAPKTTANTPNPGNERASNISICRPGDSQVFVDITVKVEPSIGFVLKRKQKYAITNVKEDIRLLFHQGAVFGSTDFYLDVAYTGDEVNLVVQFNNITSRPPQGATLVARLGYWTVYSTSRASYDIHCKKAKSQKIFVYSQS